jgi:glyoxylase-like metal-dependent hydrolase (beta-lactamase superfamily II)
LIVTGTAQRQAWLDRRMPPAEEVAPGLWSVPVTIPDSPLRYTLCYLICSGSSVLAVDPGWASEDGWRDLTSGMKEAGFGPEAVTAIVVTHVHPDHHGQSDRLRESSGAPIAMHEREVEALPSRMLATVTSQDGGAGPFGGGPAGDRAWLERCGVPPDVAAELTVRLAEAAGYLAMPEPDVLLRDGQALDLPGRDLRVVWTPGHTPGHICLHDTAHDLLLTGDHLLPRITPNIGLTRTRAGAASPLHAYLDSLAGMGRYDSAEALPAHEYRFRGIAGRAADLVHHHDERAAEIVRAVMADPGLSAWQVTERLTWSRGWYQITGFMRRAALAETAAHLAWLRDENRLTVRMPDRGPASLWPAAG